jgi:fused signal recognition particle receptor
MDVTSPEVLAAAGAVVVASGGYLLIRLRRRRPSGEAEPGAAAAGATPPVGNLRAALSATGRRFRERLDAALGRGDDARFEALEEALLGADVGVPTTTRLLDGVRERVRGSDDPAAIRDALRREMLAVLTPGEPAAVGAAPWVVLVTGVNGVGKTTTIGKLASHHTSGGKKVLLVAADTFRAAAIEQLGVWAGRTGADIVRHEQGADPSAVVFDGMRAARARGVDVVLVDTAGRLHTRSPLMDELGKVRRTLGREIPGAPHEALLVLDATTGQNALNQARAFTEAAGVTGVVVTKLDGTAKGGVVLAVSQELGIPVRWIGVGEGIDDLRPFDPEEFVDGLLAAD